MKKERERKRVTGRNTERKRNNTETIHWDLQHWAPPHISVTLLLSYPVVLQKLNYFKLELIINETETIKAVCWTDQKCMKVTSQTVLCNTDWLTDSWWAARKQMDPFTK